MTPAMLAAPPVLQQCNTCTFWRVTASPDGECHRYPPTPNPNRCVPGTTIVISTWPLVDQGAWCGEWAKT